MLGVTLTVEKVGSGCSKDLANNKASSLLKRSDHFWSNWSNLESCEDLCDLGSDLDGLSEGSLEVCGVGLSTLVFFFLSEHEPGDFTIPWSSTAPTTVTEDGSMREELASCLGFSEDFLESRFSFLSL